MKTHKFINNFFWSRRKCWKIWRNQEEMLKLLKIMQITISEVMIFWKKIKEKFKHSGRMNSSTIWWKGLCRSVHSFKSAIWTTKHLTQTRRNMETKKERRRRGNRRKNRRKIQILKAWFRKTLGCRRRSRNWVQS